MKRKSAILFFLAFFTLAASVFPQDKESRKPLIGIAPIKNSTTEPLSIHQLRLGLLQELNGKVTEAVEVFGTSTDEIVADALKKKCDFILYDDVIFARRMDRGPREVPGGRDSDPYAPAGKFAVRIRYKLIAPEGRKPRMEDIAVSANPSAVTAQEAVEGALHIVREFVVSELRTKK